MIATLLRCGGATAQAHKACDRSATQAVLFKTPTGNRLDPFVEVEVNMCDSHAGRLRVGSARGRLKVLSKRSL